MRPYRGWSLGLMPRTETPPPISEGRAWKASRGEHLSRSQQSRGQSLASRACALARALERKICISDKAGAQSRLLAGGSELSNPLPGISFLGREFPGLQLSHGEPGSMASYQRYSRGNAPFSPLKITYPIETHRVKKPKLLR